MEKGCSLAVCAACTLEPTVIMEVLVVVLTVIVNFN